MQEVLLQFLEWEKGTSTVHPDFRLWITTEVHDAFPISLLQICIKFTNEAPSGIVMASIYFSKRVATCNNILYTTLQPSVNQVPVTLNYVMLVYS